VGKPVIFVVDDSVHELKVCKHYLKELYAVYTASSAAQMFETLKDLLPELILLDVLMPDISGYEAARTLKNDNRYKDIPIIFLSGLTDEKSEEEGFNAGAVDYIYKPYNARQLIRRIDTQIQLLNLQKGMKQLQSKIDETAHRAEEMIKEQEEGDFDANERKS